MPFSGGVYTRSNGTQSGSGTWADAKTDGNKITTTQHDLHDQDLADALSNCMLKDGTQVLTQNIAMNSKKLTGLAVGTASTDSATLGQVQSGAVNWCGTSGGTADAQTLTPSPAVTALTAGMRFGFIAGAGLTNTWNCTINISGLGAIELRDPATGTIPLLAKYITAGQPYELWFSSSGGCYLKNPSYCLSGLTGISAAGSNQAGATALTHRFNSVGTITAGQGVRLPTASVGMEIIVLNNHATENLKLYATGTQTISGSPMVTMTPNQMFRLDCLLADRWSYLEQI